MRINKEIIVDPVSYKSVLHRAVQDAGYTFPVDHEHVLIALQKYILKLFVLLRSKSVKHKGIIRLAIFKAYELTDIFVLRCNDYRYNEQTKKYFLIDINEVEPWDSRSIIINKN